MLPLSMAALIATSPGQTFGVSIFNEPIRQALNLTHSQLASAYMLGTLLAAAPITYIGALMDRYGLRRAMLAAVVLFGTACLAMSQVSGWFSLLLGFLLLRMLGPGALAFLSGNTLAFWFERRLGMVEGLRHLGMAGAMAVIPALNLWLVGQFGWRGAYLLLGLGVWGVMLPLVLFLFRNRPEDVGQTLEGAAGENGRGGAARPAAELRWGLTLRQALDTRSFWIVTGGTTLFSLVHTAIFFCLVPIFLERGLSQSDAAGVLTVFAVSLAVMHLVGGSLADRLPAPLLLAAGLAGLTLSMGLLQASSGPWMAYTAGVAMGVSQGLFFGVSHPLWARYFGRRHLGRIRGLLMTINVAASSLGPLTAGLLRDHLGTFDPALILFAAAPLPVALASLLATAPKRPAGAEPSRTV